jgi:hypothetical protein
MLTSILPAKAVCESIGSDKAKDALAKLGTQEDAK